MISTKKIKVLCGKDQKIFEINLEENNTYESFLKKLNEEFNRKNTYQLMATNSSEQFTILNSNNYLNILNEDIPEGLTLFMSEIVKAPEGMESNAETNKEEKGETMDEEDDADFIIENTQINEEINKNNNIINIEQEKNNDNKEQDKLNENIDNDNQNIIKEEENELNNNNTNNNPFFRSVVLKDQNNSINDNSHNLEKINNLFLDDRQKEENKDLINKNYILSSSLVNHEMFKLENCSKCNSALKGIKYICCICDNYNLCEECELSHIHPCFKYKTQFISNIVETSNFIDKCYGFKLPFESTGYSKLFRKEYDLKILPMSDLSFCLRPNKKINIPIKIVNYSKETIKSSQITIICKNQKNIFLSPNEFEKYTIEAGKEHILNIKCIAPEKTGIKENIFIEIYSNELNIKSSRRLSYEYIIEVNFDTEDDKLNMELKNNDYIFCFNKEHKKLALKLLKLCNNEYKIQNIFSCLFDNNWDHKQALKALKKKN